MSAESELARFDTRPRRAAQSDKNSEQIDLRALGAREQGQLALNEIERGATCSENRRNLNNRVTASNPVDEDLEAALGCARVTIDGLHEQVAHLEAERDRLREELESER